MRQAAHRHAVARGEREVEQLRAGLRVLEKHLVKIAEPEEQQRVLRQFAFDAAILRHHGRELGFGGHAAGKLNVNGTIASNNFCTPGHAQDSIRQRSSKNKIPK